MKKIYKEAGNLQGLDCGSRVRSLVDAALHLGLSLEQAKSIIGNHFKRNGNKEAVALVASASVGQFGVFTL